jgi:hypothetical protein
MDDDSLSFTGFNRLNYRFFKSDQIVDIILTNHKLQSVLGPKT